MSYSVKTFTAVLVTTILFSASNALAMQISDEEVGVIGRRFVAFIKEVGQLKRDVKATDIAELFDPQCTKIVNGEPAFAPPSLENHAAQLNRARSGVGEWKVESAGWEFICPKGNYATQIFWEGEELGPHSTMFALWINEAGKIYAIKEAFGPCNPDHVLFQKTQEGQLNTETSEDRQ